MSLTLYEMVRAGTPTPVEEGERFDLAAYLIKHPYDTFYVRVCGSSMADAGILDGDLLVVDRCLEPRSSDVVVARVEDGFTIKRFKREHGRLRLVPANPDYEPVDISEDTRICGVATFAIRQL